ncbi:hypothetical protein CIL05_11400 [Virgibacillus profundi]|uniref:DUF2515 domain-containing protein n=1 Tax=Virgibacillus profundi TaxID=2024555 RepID=A0A2A2IDX7_9BACI|nr:DUF2515 family protein [Virgibacillus profundi]PAV29464.1 hypothetical protein CIL05_11400 [Virgibacillus profundi]PXY53633.1 DUF2515 domain-containing protein [Virgibacillus profundi]
MCKVLEQDSIHYITKATQAHNMDNISRTNAYQKFYLDYPEIKWAFVASLVSRNAGWNMTDLHLAPYKNILGSRERNRLFMTYERANWLIFSDAYPQLLIYKMSSKQSKPLFHLLKFFNVSLFIIREWHYFWKTKNKERLMTALIINEQNIIQNSVIKQSFFEFNVFRKLPYLMQNFINMNAVIIPTRDDRLYGSFVHNFTNVTNRITLGKNIATIIYTPNIYQKTLDFAIKVEHTGSRRDYERFLKGKFPPSPLLRSVYPVIQHQDIVRNDWYRLGGIKKKWQQNKLTLKEIEIKNSFYRKRKMLYAYYHFRNVFM